MRVPCFCHIGPLVGRVSFGCLWCGSRLEHPNLRWKRLLYSLVNVLNLRCSSELMDQGGGVQVEAVFNLGSYEVSSSAEVALGLVLK